MACEFRLNFFNLLRLWTNDATNDGMTLDRIDTHDNRDLVFISVCIFSNTKLGICMCYFQRLLRNTRRIDREYGTTPTIAFVFFENPISTLFMLSSFDFLISNEGFRFKRSQWRFGLNSQVSWCYWFAKHYSIAFVKSQIID